MSLPGSPLSPARRSDATANAMRILDAAADLLRRDPDVPIGEIAQRAGVGRSTLYRHFETREALVEAVRRRARDVADADHPPALRPPGELANTSVTPLSVPDVLNKVAPFQVSEQIVAEAQRLDGVQAAALYVADLAGLLLRKLAGAPAFPDEIGIGGSIGTEIPREAHAAIRRAITTELPGAVVTPLNLRGRAIGMLVVVGAENDALRDLAREAAVALALADGYTDGLQAARRARPTSPAAEIQQNLLPNRIHRLSGATLAGNVLPGYDVGGDWFDVADNADAVWLGVADIAGTGVRAAGPAAVLLGAFRSARHQGEDPAGVIAQMHEVLRGVAGPDTTATTTIGCWNATTSVFRWVSAGEHGPLLGHVDGTLEELDPEPAPPLGSAELRLPVGVRQRRLDPGQRLVLLSDGGLHCRDGSGTPFGTDGVRVALRASAAGTAAATVHALEHAICTRLDGDLADDVTTIVLAPHTR